MKEDLKKYFEIHKDELILFGITTACELACYLIGFNHGKNFTIKFLKLN